MKSRKMEKKEYWNEPQKAASFVNGKLNLQVNILCLRCQIKRCEYQFIIPRLSILLTVSETAFHDKKNVKAILNF